MIAYQPTFSQKVIRGHRGIKECMASAMQEMAGAGEAVTADALVKRGFTPAAVRRFGEDAANMARRRSIRHLERNSA